MGISSAEKRGRMRASSFYSDWQVPRQQQPGAREKDNASFADGQGLAMV